ncbi:hypothetical protein MUU72_22655 [Streptomyces sp. RS10V-4]|uniref:hypothetical protein n=1 Tax=Streptomyces rhizoryzae TaxID=2932493 RepID=UPI002005BF73|nr:hypothetical protein [Streptomyces rhizoryzae]MCK7625868.1 hypothetical protein [Streptomyces rhizoryzae]
MGGAQDGAAERARGLAREAVRQLAPEELALFEETAAAYFDDPRQEGRRTRPEPLGIGIDAVLIGTLTQFALPVAAAVVSNIATDALRREGRRGRWWRRSRRTGGAEGGGGGGGDNPFAAPGTGPAAVAGRPPGPGELERLRRIAHDRATALGLPPAQAQLLADAVIGGLLAPPAPDEEENAS